MTGIERRRARRAALAAIGSLTEDQHKQLQTLAVRAKATGNFQPLIDFLKSLISNPDAIKGIIAFIMEIAELFGKK